MQANHSMIRAHRLLFLRVLPRQGRRIAPCRHSRDQDRARDLQAGQQFQRTNRHRLGLHHRRRHLHRRLVRQDQEAEVQPQGKRQRGTSLRNRSWNLCRQMPHKVLIQPAYQRVQRNGF